MFGKSLRMKLSRATVAKQVFFVAACSALIIGWQIRIQAQDFSKSFKVLPDSGSLEIKTKMGSVTVLPAEGNVIQISARQAGNGINAEQPTPQGTVIVEVMNDTTVDLIVNVPASTALDILCVKCGVVVKGLHGPIKIGNTAGDIQLTGIRSSKVEARSMGGNVYYSGEIKPRGSYFLKSFSGHVDAALPVGAKFSLNATAGRGGIEIDSNDFQLTVHKQTSHLVQGLVGLGGATLTLWTQEGSIRVHKK
jgi:hypothetical protein